MTPEDTPGAPAEGARLSFDAPHLAFGICVAIVGVALTLDRLQILDAARILRFWPVGLILIGAGMVAQAFWPGADVHAGGRPRRPFTPLVFFAVMLSVGLLAGQRGELRNSIGREGTGPDGTVSLFSIMGEDRRISPATRFRGAEMTSVMGGSDLDLRQATMSPGEVAVIDVFAVMGGVELRVPGEWIVDVQAVPLMGGIKDQRTRSGALQTTDATAPRIVVRGFIMMGGLTIKS